MFVEKERERRKKGKKIRKLCVYEGNKLFSRLFVLCISRTSALAIYTIYLFYLTLLVRGITDSVN